MSNSSLVSYTKLSPNHSGARTHAIDRITPHCVVGQCSVETLGNIFLPASRQASCNYGIGSDGRVGMYVEEKNRSWCSSSNANDQRAVTIECASDVNAPYTMNSVVYNILVKLCVDICRRNGKKKLIWLGDKNKTLNYSPKSDEMVLTVHRWFDNKSCPGDWLYSRLGDLADQVTEQLGGGSGSSGGSAASGEMYRVRKTWADEKSQKGAFAVWDNAKNCANQNPGYTVFDSSGNAVYTSQAGTSAPSAPVEEQLAVDGSFGPATVRRSQEWRGTEVDGIISDQPESNKKYLCAVYAGCWIFKKSGYDAGSSFIRALQSDFKMLGHYTGAIDGWCGKQTVIAWQKWLQAEGYYTGAIDGSMGPQTVKAFQRYLNDH